MAAADSFPPPNDTYEVLLPLAATPPPSDPDPDPCAPLLPHLLPTKPLPTDLASDAPATPSPEPQELQEPFATPTDEACEEEPQEEFQQPPATPTDEPREDESQPRPASPAEEPLEETQATEQPKDDSPPHSEDDSPSQSEDDSPPHSEEESPPHSEEESPESPASQPRPVSPPRSAPPRTTYSAYLAPFRAGSRGGDASLGLPPPMLRPFSASPDYSCLPKDKIQFILSLKEALKRHGTVPSTFNRLGFFEEIHRLLADEVWQIRNEATLLCLALLPYLGQDLDACMAVVLPRLVPNLGDSRHLLRRSSLRLLRAYAAISRDPEGLVDDIITHGVNHRSRRVSQLVIAGVEHLMRGEALREVDLAPLVHALLARLHDDELQPAVLPTLLALRGLVGDATFATYLSHMDADAREDLDRMLQDEELQFPDDDKDVVVVARQPAPTRPPTLSPRPSLEYGVVEADTMNKIRHSEDWKTRAEGCEELRGVVKALTDAGPLLPHLPPFVQLLDSLFDDNNFRISLTILDIFRLLLDLLDKDTLKEHLRQLVHAVRKHVGDSKVVVRIENMRVFRKLLQAASPAAVVPILCDALISHRSSRVREDSLNLIIYALMTFPSYEFDLKSLADCVSVAVVDPKRRVRHAALECLAAVAQFLGPAKLGPLMAAVDRLEDDEEEAEGVLEAVQARLARRQLPRVSPDGLIEYSLVVPVTGRHSSLTRIKGADVDWVLRGAGGGAAGSQGGGWPSALSASFTASDSYVDALAFTHPQSSPPQRSRHAPPPLGGSLHRKRSISDVTLNKTSPAHTRGVRTACPATGRRGTPGPPGSTSALRRPSSPVPDAPLLLGARLSPGHSPGRSRSLPGLQVSARGAPHTAIRRERSLSSVTAVLPPPTAYVTPIEGSRAPSSGRVGALEDSAMWRMLHGAPHWEVSAKKMWSPGPPASREPVRLPFLDVTPTTVLQRLRDAPDTHHAHHTHHAHVEVSMSQVGGRGGAGRGVGASLGRRRRRAQVCGVVPVCQPTCVPPAGH
ncbi:TOG array regulator of axonemal microtubules protein 1-like [Eriocheir sinensis]|uniref:TOG array regulator of axonemal microtubules protein 1-like n=1 Tax=Eriocheir sinensis TaxID=95602 RepID=UPI0021C5FC9B|nr:TOG array regulator of axonemal microtubules protein 1-like [Eriocheir sinensis]